MNKKGMLLASETLKIILSVIAIGFLIFLLTSLYFSNVNSKKLVDATSTIERVSDVILRVENGEIESEQVTTLVPAGWHIFFFTEDELKPNSCADQNCLCICDEIWESSLLGISQANECSDEGICIMISKLKEFDNFEIGVADNPTSIEIRKFGDWVEVIQI